MKAKINLTSVVIYFPLLPLTTQWTHICNVQSLLCSVVNSAMHIICWRQGHSLVDPLLIIIFDGQHMPLPKIQSAPTFEQWIKDIASVTSTGQLCA
jgi:hypothetical protein